MFSSRAPPPGAITSPSDSILVVLEAFTHLLDDQARASILDQRRLWFDAHGSQRPLMLLVLITPAFFADSRLSDVVNQG